MMNNKLQFVAIDEKDLEQAYAGFKAELYDVSEEAFGWDETFQHERFKQAYDPKWFYWVEHDSKRVGYVCYNVRSEDLHVHLIIIFKTNQNAGYGKDAMILLSDIAKKNHVNVTLSTLKNNQGAVAFYKRLGYEVTDEDEYFYELLLKN